jgi:hypothetical protein
MELIIEEFQDMNMWVIFFKSIERDIGTIKSDLYVKWGEML